jgi:hypothetical protein
MVELFGKIYYIDIDGITDKCRTGYTIKDEELNEEESELTETTEINIFKYEIIKMCLERVLGEIDEVDDELGAFGKNTSTTSFKIAFNTLIKHKILIEEINEDDE